MRNPIDLWRGDQRAYPEWSQLQKMVDRMWGDLPNPKWQSKNAEIAFSPQCEVTEDKMAYHFKFDLPGINKDQVKVEIHDNRMIVTGERKEERKEDNKRYHFSELSYGSFMRTFTFPTDVDAEKVEAKFDNGVLNINVAKSETTLSRQVNIK